MGGVDPLRPAAFKGDRFVTSLDADGDVMSVSARLLANESGSGQVIAAILAPEVLFHLLQFFHSIMLQGLAALVLLPRRLLLGEPGAVRGALGEFFRDTDDLVAKGCRRGSGWNLGVA